MNFRIILYSFSLFIIIAACNKQEKTTGTKNMSMPVTAKKTEAQRIVDQAIEKHGGKLIENSIIKFTFRDRQYKATRRGESFEYERAWTDSTGQQIRDVMNNGGMYREINGKRLEISEEDQNKYSNSINSVIYFALLPYFLNDKAVNKAYLGEVNIKGKAYHKIKVTFQQEGGGKDFEDEYTYWFQRDSLTMDYLAYNYLTDGGGARFREAYNVRYVNGVRFADYTNFKPQDATNRDVTTFDDLFTKGNLEELSKIETENIEVIILK